MCSVSVHIVSNAELMRLHGGMHACMHGWLMHVMWTEAVPNTDRWEKYLMITGEYWFLQRQFFLSGNSTPFSSFGTFTVDNMLVVPFLFPMNTIIIIIVTLYDSTWLL